MKNFVLGATVGVAIGIFVTTLAYDNITVPIRFRSAYKCGEIDAYLRMQDRKPYTGTSFCAKVRNAVLAEVSPR